MTVREDEKSTNVTEPRLPSCLDVRGRYLNDRGGGTVSPSDYLKQQWPLTRQLSRYSLDTPIVLTTATNTIFRGWCNDVSEGGMCATISAPLKAGEVIALEFQLPSLEEPLRIRGVVRHSDGFRHGFEFFAITPPSDSESGNTANSATKTRKPTVPDAAPVLLIKLAGECRMP